MSDFISRYDAVLFLAFAVWVVASGVVALTVDFHVGLWLMFGPLLIGLLLSAFVPVVREAGRQIKGRD